MPKITENEKLRRILIKALVDLSDVAACGNSMDNEMRERLQEYVNEIRGYHWLGIVTESKADVMKAVEIIADNIEAILNRRTEGDEDDK